MRLPKLGVGNMDHAAPEFRLGLMLLPIAEKFGVERGKFRRHPRLGVNAVGDAGDRHFMHRHAGPNVFPKRLADFAVQFAHAIRVPAHPQRQDGHAESRQRIRARLAEAEKFVERDLQLRRKIAEIFLHHLARERVVSRGHRCVGGEDIGRRDHLECGIKIEMLLHDSQPDSFERKEGRVAFVHVEDFRLDAERAERFHAANAEHHFLAHPHFEIAAVELRGDQTILGVVFRRVGIEQIKADAADLELPDFREHFAVKNADGDEQIRIAAAHFADGKMVKILVEVDGLLRAFLVDLLFEISVTIEQADGDKVEIEIAGGFAVIARENAEAAGIIRNRFVKAELSGKIGDRFLDLARGAGFPVGVFPREITAKGIVNVFQFAQETFVVRDFDETGLARKLKHPDGVVIGPIPKLGIEMPEKPARGRLPGPPQIEDHLAQRLECRGQSGNYIINLVVGHGTAMKRRREFVRKILGGNFSVKLSMMI